MTKGRLGELESAGVEEEGEEKEGIVNERRKEGEVERRPPSSRRPEKWGPDAASIAKSIGVISSGIFSLSLSPSFLSVVSISLSL